MVRWARYSTAGLALLTLAALVAGCASTPSTLPRAAKVDLDRFMGDWYVIAHIPTRLERDAYDAVESYTLQPDGAIQTTFRYRDGSFDAPLKTMRPVGRVREGTGNAVWGMQFVWPIEAEYVVAYVDDGYRLTVIGRSARDYAWIMARTPRISESEYAAAVRRLDELGYATDALRRVPQSQSEP